MNLWVSACHIAPNIIGFHDWNSCVLSSILTKADELVLQFSELSEPPSPNSTEEALSCAELLAGIFNWNLTYQGSKRYFSACKLTIIQQLTRSRAWHIVAKNLIEKIWYDICLHYLCSEFSACKKTWQKIFLPTVETACRSSLLPAALACFSAPVTYHHRSLWRWLWKVEWREWYFLLHILQTHSTGTVANDRSGLLWIFSLLPHGHRIEGENHDHLC